LSDENLLIRAEKLAKSKNYESAIQSCIDYLTLVPADREGLRLLAFIYSLKRDYNNAINVISEVIELCEDNPEPCDHFNWGRWALEERDFKQAASSFLKVIELCKRYEDNYYLESAYLFYAVALVELSLTNKAIEALSHISDECGGFAMGKVLSKVDLLKQLPTRKSN
jgi:tetratricopeptide (TPR) repeat protein